MLPVAFTDQYPLELLGDFFAGQRQIIGRIVGMALVRHADVLLALLLGLIVMGDDIHPVINHPFLLLVLRTWRYDVAYVGHVRDRPVSSGRGKV